MLNELYFSFRYDTILIGVIMIHIHKSNVLGRIVTQYNVYPDIAGRYSELKELSDKFPGKSISLGWFRFLLFGRDIPFECSFQLMIA